MTALIDLTGKRFGRLLVVARAENGRGGRRRWVCVCDCGNTTTVFGHCLRRRDATRSCGCLAREQTRVRSLKHGCFGSPEYISWVAMKARCTNPNNKAFPDYGGRGIAVCGKWRASFIDFLAYVGPRPKGTTLDRWPDKNGNYEPGNVRWATPKQQRGNQRPPKALPPFSAEHRAKLSAAHQGKPLSAEHCAKLSAATQAHWAKIKASSKPLVGSRLDVRDWQWLIP
jgi:hypothetical protein